MMLTPIAARASAPAHPPLPSDVRMRARRVLIVDHHPLLRLGVRQVIEGEEDLYLCGELDRVQGARSAIEELKPDVLVMDIDFADTDGFELIRDVRTRHPNLPILVLSVHDESLYAARMLSAGANGYIMKQASSQQFLEAVRRVLRGGTYVSEPVGRNLINHCAARNPPTSTHPIESLSNRELQILRMIGLGTSTREAAQSLHLSVKTVESHRQRIKRKLSLRNSPQLVRYAVNWANERPPTHASDARPETDLR